MCLFPGQGGTPGLPPTEKAEKWGDMLKYALGLGVVVSIMYFVVGVWDSGLIDLILTFVGFWAIRNRAEFHVQPILCFTIFGIIRFVWTLVSCLQFATGLVSPKSDAAYVMYVYSITLCLSVIYHFVATYLAYLIYNELRIVAAGFLGQLAAAAPMGGPPPGMNPSFGSFPAPGNADYEQGISSKSKSGFKAFQGKGHRLGEA